MRLSVVSKTQPLDPTSGSHVSSGAPRGKWSRWRSNRTPCFVSVSRIARELQRFSSRYRTNSSGGDGEGECALPTDGFFDLLWRAAIFFGEFGDGLPGVETRRD